MDARYSRQLALPGFGAPAQARLAASRVLVIGAGGLGSTVIPALVAAGVGTVGIVDDDRVELSNLHRQHIHGMADLGRAKVDSAADTAAALNPEVSVVTVGERLTAANALGLFAGYDLVLDGSDNFPTRYLANDAAVLTGIPLVWGAVSQYGGQVGVSWGTTYRDLFPAAPPPGSVQSCEEGGVLPTTVGVIGSLMATEALKLITGIGNPLIGRVTVFDGLAGDFRTIAYGKDPDAAPITGLIDYELFCGVSGSRTLEGTLLDVREAWEVEIVALPGAVHIPLGELEQRLGELPPGPVTAYCHHGIRSARARDILLAHGIAASHLEGGIDAWARDRDPAMARY
jgi:sulfur-carrier protein adenylyltransferase/sulfurtransferase